MSESKHDLVHELPQYADQIHRLKMSDGHFQRLSRDYHGLVKELHQIEIGQETPGDEYVETLKKKRLSVLDEIVATLKGA